LVTSSANSLRVFISNDDKSSLQQLDYPFGKESETIYSEYLASADFNNDGLPDLTATYDFRDRVYVILNDLTPGRMPSADVAPLPAVPSPTPTPIPMEIIAGWNDFATHAHFSLGVVVKTKNWGSIPIKCNQYILIEKPNGQYLSVVKTSPFGTSWSLTNCTRQGIAPIVRDTWPIYHGTETILNIQTSNIPKGNYKLISAIVKPKSLHKAREILGITEKEISVE
ncbi:MAG: FG-GAP repeat protein, partial [Phycisphaerales bacterium]